METKHVVRESRALALAKEQGKGERSFQQQIEAVEKTFEDAAALNASSLQHPTDPNLQCVSLLPVRLSPRPTLPCPKADFASASNED